MWPRQDSTGGKKEVCDDEMGLHLNRCDGHTNLT